MREGAQGVAQACPVTTMAPLLSATGGCGGAIAGLLGPSMVPPHPDRATTATPSRSRRGKQAGTLRIMSGRLSNATDGFRAAQRAQRAETAGGSGRCGRRRPSARREAGHLRGRLRAASTGAVWASPRVPSGARGPVRRSPEVRREAARAGGDWCVSPRKLCIPSGRGTRGPVGTVPAFPGLTRSLLGPPGPLSKR
jgi:hypothetical protein